MGERHVAEAEGPEPKAAPGLDDVKRNLVAQSLLVELAADQAGGEARGVERHAEIGGEIGDRADMILVAVGQHDAEQVPGLALDELEVGQDQVDARISGIGEGQAEIDHHPFAVGAVEIDVHADLAGSAEGEEKKLVAGCGHVRGFPVFRRHSREGGNPLTQRRDKGCTAGLNGSQPSRG